MNDSALLDLVIIGAAAAGPSAAIYAARRNLNFVVVTTDMGGEVALSGEVKNWLGIEETTGIELSQMFEKHMKSYGPQIDLGFKVTGIKQDGNIHIVHAESFSGEKKTYRTKTVIVATGIHPRTLDIPGEAELKGRGVTYCTVCDGPLFKGKVTATIGAGTAALESALMMAGISSKVYLVTKYANTPETQGGFPKGETVLLDKVKETDNIEIVYDAMTKEIKGDQKVQGILCDVAGEERLIETEAVMVHIGVDPNSTFIDCVEKDSTGQIITNAKTETSCPGIFAAGDVTDLPHNQIIIAAGQGATAALTAIEYINKWTGQ